jgi:hypothetical protein
MADQYSQTGGPDEQPEAEIIAFPAPTGASVPDDQVHGDTQRRLRDVIGEVLRDERTRQERTLAEVADDAAVSLAYLSEIERGTKDVSSDLLDAVVRSLGLDLADVLERSARRLRVGSQRSGPSMRLLAA